MDLSLLPLIFSLILTVASRLLHLYNINDKNIYINGENILHNEGHPERFAELKGEEKKDEGDRGVQEEKKENHKG